MHRKVFIILILVSKTFCSTDKSPVQISNQTFEASDGSYAADYGKSYVRKCCPFGRAYDTVAKECLHATVDFATPVHDDDNFVISVANTTDMIEFVFGKPNCNRSSMKEEIVSLTQYQQKLGKDGSLSYKEPDVLGCPTFLSTDDYCLDMFAFTDEQGNRFYKLDAIICDDTRYILTTFQKTKFFVTGICMVISCVFILATVAIKACILDIFSMHGRLIIAYLFCMFVSFSILAYVKIKYSITNYNCSMETNVCYGLVFTNYFFLMSAFFWLNVMSYDVWLTFSGKRGQFICQLDSMSINSRFRLYVLYAFGTPMLMTVLLAILNFSNLPENDMLPNVGKYDCFLNEKRKLLYQLGPMALLCSVNFIFFILTWKKMAEDTRSISHVIGSRRRANNESKIIVKLSIVMGIFWLFEIISAIFSTSDVTSFFNWFFFIIDTYNVLSGLIIFIVLICKRSTSKRIRKRYEEIRSGKLRVNSGNSTSASAPSRNSRALTNSHRNGRFESMSSANTSFSTGNRHSSVESAPSSGTVRSDKVNSTVSDFSGK